MLILPTSVGLDSTSDHVTPQQTPDYTGKSLHIFFSEPTSTLQASSAQPNALSLPRLTDKAMASVGVVCGKGAKKA
eukprot:COSAG03_NODE_210_length_10594_cov_32.990472_10_plen_76_part_00